MDTPYLALLGAILVEVVATNALKASDGFTRLAPSAVTVVGYAISFYLLSVALKTIPVGVAYAIWSGIGIVLVTIVAWVVFGQRLDTGAVAGIALILAGVVVIRVFSGVQSS
ncbi:DMT family transporter [Ramlibacter sp. MMS24-I3-19]|uniref:DMT family transporter n=1 Tax=Ramlibacter sp. MMS24-I3-19 TaxID=3416606 RepID=UPI003D048BE9